MGKALENKVTTKRKCLHLEIYIWFNLFLAEKINTKMIVTNFGVLSNNFPLLPAQGCICQNVANSV